MKILIVGGGGREHAIAWKLAGEAGGHELFCAPGNAGTAQIAVNLPVAAEDIQALRDWAVSEKPDLTVVGPEAPLCAGLTDLLEDEGLRVFGPSREAAKLEGSKIFAKEIMLAAGVPTAKAAFFSDADEALQYVRSEGAPLVVKADGLAAGKGVIVCSTAGEAESAVRSMLSEACFGDAGRRIVVEECLEGEEASIMALVDGENFVALAPSQDHKRAFDGDTGPNTGGMGAYSPTGAVLDNHWPVIEKDVFGATLNELKKRGLSYKGVLYAGIMITGQGPKVLEFNCRFGDPETQVVLPRMDTGLLPAMEACVSGSLTPELVKWRADHAVCVVMTAGGYPGKYRKGAVIEGLDRQIPGNAVVFHAGTAELDGNVVTSGGRVLGVTALAPTLGEAVREAYSVVSGIHFENAAFRTDIAFREIRRSADVSGGN